MDRNVSYKLAAGVAAGLAVAGGGAALAASQLDSPKEESQAIVNDAAKQLGVEPSALSSALKKAIENRIDAAVAAGRLTKEQGDALKARVEAGEVPLFGVGPGFGHHGPYGHGEKLEAAADYLGLSEDQLREQLESGKTLAQIARDRGKSVDGLVDALVAAESKEIDEAVADGRLTKAQADEIKANLEAHITALVNGERGPGHLGFRFRFEGGPPPGFRPTI